MNETVTVHHTVYSSGRERLDGEPLSSDREAVRRLLKRGDSSLDRTRGGFFFEGINDIFVVVYMTPLDTSRPGVRKGEFIYNVFEFETKVAEQLDLVSVRDCLDDYCVQRRDAPGRGRIENPFSSTMWIVPKATEYDLQTVAAIWDQLRRNERAATARLDAMSYFYSRVSGSIQRVSVIDGPDADSERFDVRSGPLPDDSPERLGDLTEFLRQLDRRDDSPLQFEELPSLEEQYRKQIQARADASLRDLREEFQVDDEFRREWDALFEQQFIPKLNRQAERFLELQEIRLDPDRSLEDELDKPSGSFGGLLSGTLGNDAADPMEEQLLNETEKLTEELHQSFFELLEQHFENRVNEMLERGEETAAELRGSDAYKRYQDL